MSDFLFALMRWLYDFLTNYKESTTMLINNLELRMWNYSYMEDTVTKIASKFIVHKW